MSYDPTVRLNLLALAFALSAGACAPKPTPSQVKIRDGAQVAANSQGPENVSTAGLLGQSDDGTFTCSAAIIGQDVLVTAGHCAPAGGRLQAYFGTDQRDANREDFISARAYEVNPNFSTAEAVGGLPLDDVAVVRLSSPIPDGYQPAPILPSDQDLHSGESVRLAGFGITEAGDDSGILRYVDTTYVGPDSAGRLQINDPARRGACSGDSGGPLFAQYNGQWYVAGVLSGGPIPCRGINVYTSLAAQKSFLTQAVSQLEQGM